jgi:Tol biopolymer transport system component
VSPAAPHKIAFARVFTNAGQMGLFVASADGSDEHPLLAAPDIDYAAAWSPGGKSIIFSSDRNGSGDLYRVAPDGSSLERVTDDPAYDDQAAFSADGKRLVFVSSRDGGIPHLWTMDLRTRRATALTSGAGGDFRRRGRRTARGSRFRPTAAAPCRLGTGAGSTDSSSTSTSYALME